MKATMLFSCTISVVTVYLGSCFVMYKKMLRVTRQAFGSAVREKSEGKGRLDSRGTVESSVARCQLVTCLELGHRLHSFCH